MKRIVLLSGGIDSTTCLAMAKEEEGEIVALNCYYGQKNKREMQSARDICEYYGVELKEFDLSQIFKYSSCPMLTNSGKDIEHKTYREQTEESGGQPISSYVPFRNGIMLSAAVAIAYSIGAEEVWYGAHKDDAEGGAYPDCTKAFVEAMNNAVTEGTAHRVRIKAPLISLRKKDVVRIGLELNVPYEKTWSCYEAGEHPCGVCGTCIDVKKAFADNGAEYPVK